MGHPSVIIRPDNPSDVNVFIPSAPSSDCTAMKHTIKDVAAYAGFSIATVSRAINAPHTVNRVTLAKIREAIDALQFRPSPLGRQLRGERTRLIGIVLPTLANPVFAECLQGSD